MQGLALAFSKKCFISAPRPSTVLDLLLRGRSLLPFQKEALTWALDIERTGGPSSKARGGLLALDMGLGKTLISLLLALSPPPCSIYPALPLQSQVSLVLCCRVVVDTFLQQCLKFFGKGVNIRVFHSDFVSEEAGGKHTFGRPAIWLTTYETLVRAYGRSPGESPLFDTSFVRVLCDESQKFSNRSSKTFACVQRLHRHSSFCFTGTPVMNCERDLLNQLLFCGVKDRRQAADHVFRRTSLEVRPEMEETGTTQFRIPETRFHNVDLVMGKGERLGYDKSRAEAAETLNLFQEGQVKFTAVLNQFCILRQACSGSLGIKTACVQKIVEKVKQDVSGNGRIVFFSSFPVVLRQIHAGLSRRYPGSCIKTLDGSTSSKLRWCTVRGLDPDSAVAPEEVLTVPDILLCTFRTVGLGVNLTSVQHAVLLDPCWNESESDQAVARLCRMGQIFPVVHVWRLLCTGTIEDRMVKVCEEKRKASEEFVLRTASQNGINVKELASLFA